MCAWHQDFASRWNVNVSNQFSTQFVNESTAKGSPGDLPELNTGYNTPEEILDARIQEVLAEGFSAAKISSSTLFGALENYAIVNYWSEADYTGYGHVPGAMQYTPRESMSLDSDLKTLPLDREVVVYGWTGQASAAVVAYLRVIGYNAKSLLWGANGMIYDELESNKWSVGAIMDYDYVTE